MPHYAYDYEKKGAVTPFEIYGILGGVLNLFPSPEEPGKWLTWGFNPYDPGSDFYTKTSTIGFAEAVMRVPMHHTNLGPADKDDDFSDYLADAARVCYERMQDLANGTTLVNAANFERAAQFGMVAIQLGNIMAAISVYNNGVEPVQSGLWPAVTPAFGSRYVVEHVHEPAEMTTQSSANYYSVIDLTSGRSVDEVDTREEADDICRNLNDDNERNWVEGQVEVQETLLLPLPQPPTVPEGYNQIPEATTTALTDYFLQHDKGWGDRIMRSEFVNALEDLYGPIQVEPTPPPAPEPEPEPAPEEPAS